MINLKEYLEIVDYRITEGSEYTWSCYGPDTHALSAWNGIHGEGGWSTNIVFDTKDQTIYEIEVCDYTNNRAYRIINPEYVKAHQTEAESRGIDENEAWDDVSYTDLETDEDWLEKARAIIAGKGYDTRVQVPLDLPDDVIYQLMKMAHDRDLTLNEFADDVLRAFIKDYGQKQTA